MDLDLGDSKVEEILLDIGYYRLGFYWNPFEVDQDHNFREGTKFSDVVHLYYLDVDLRNLLQRHLNRLEIHFRTKVIYTVSNAYSDKEVWFVDSNVVKKEFIDLFNKKVYNGKFKSNNTAIKKHRAKYLNDRYAPAWTTIEFLTFGSLLSL